MELALTGRGIHVTDEMRRWVDHKLEHLGRLEPRLTRLELEIIAEHHPRFDGKKRAEGAVSIPRKTFRAAAEAGDVRTAIDRLCERLERQLRDHHDRRRSLVHRGDGLGLRHTPIESDPSGASGPNPTEERA